MSKIGEFYDYTDAEIPKKGVTENNTISITAPEPIREQGVDPRVVRMLATFLCVALLAIGGVGVVDFLGSRPVAKAELASVGYVDALGISLKEAWSDDSRSPEATLHPLVLNEWVQEADKAALSETLRPFSFIATEAAPTADAKKDAVTTHVETIALGSRSGEITLRLEPTVKNTGQQVRITYFLRRQDQSWRVISIKTHAR